MQTISEFHAEMWKQFKRLADTHSDGQRMLNTRTDR